MEACALSFNKICRTMFADLPRYRFDNDITSMLIQLTIIDDELHVKSRLKNLLLFERGLNRELLCFGKSIYHGKVCPLTECKAAVTE